MNTRLDGSLHSSSRLYSISSSSLYVRSLLVCGPHTFFPRPSAVPPPFTRCSPRSSRSHVHEKNPDRYPGFFTRCEAAAHCNPMQASPPSHPAPPLLVTTPFSCMPLRTSKNRRVWIYSSGGGIAHLGAFCAARTALGEAVTGVVFAISGVIWQRGLLRRVSPHAQALSRRCPSSRIPSSSSSKAKK